MNVLAFDIGASSGRAMIGHFDGSTLALEEVHRFHNGTTKIRGHLYWDIPRLYGEMETGLNKATAACGIASMGIDTWGVDGAFVGANDTLIGLPYGYRDFTAENMNECIDLFGAEGLYGITGIQFLPFNTIFQLYYHERSNSPLLSAADRFLFIPDYLRFLFTGEKNAEYTSASTSQLLDARARDWSTDVLEKIGVSPDMMGDIIEPGTVCGKVDGTDIKAIAVAGHDTGSAVVSVPATETECNWAWMSSGTWSIMGIESGEPIISEEGRAKNFSNEGGAFGTIRFCKNIMGMWLAQECRRIWAAQGNDYSYDELDEMVKATPDGGPTIDVSDLRFMAPQDMISEIQAACREAGYRAPETPGEFQRCVIESLAKAYAVTLDELNTVSGSRCEKLHMVGGGIRNELLNQMTADACQVPVEAGPVEGTAIGNILVQLIANGELAGIAEARQLVRDSFPTKTFEPR